MHKLPTTITCKACGMTYWSFDARSHRRVHRQVLPVIEPQPNATLARLQGPFVSVLVDAPMWMQRRLELMGAVCRRECGWDFNPFAAGNIDSNEASFLIVDPAGRAIGGFTLELKPPILGWIWIAPAYRRQGWLRRTWEWIQTYQPGTTPRAPLSPGAAAFFAEHRTEPRPEVDPSFHAPA